MNVDADGGELGVGSGQGDVGVGDDWAGGDMGGDVMGLWLFRLIRLAE